MILQALVRYYRRMTERGAGGIAAYGYSPEKISYEIVLAPDGAVLAVNDIRDTTGKKPQPRVLDVPQPEKRTVGIKSNFLWDKTSYVLGVSATSKRADKEHEAFKALHETALAGDKDEGLQALLALCSAGRRSSSSHRYSLTTCLMPIWYFVSAMSGVTCTNARPRRHSVAVCWGLTRWAKVLMRPLARSAW